jgi:osmotically-inducible protein OsmY
LQWTTYLPKDGVKVTVEKGCVTLSGEVQREYQRRAAAKAIRYVLGVTDVSNQISVRPPLSSKAIKSDIESALKRRNRDDAENISVEVDGTDVTLRGTVRSWSERDLAQHSAWGTSGVRNVVDKITVVYSNDN